MDEDLKKRIQKSRALLQNPYAYLAPDGSYEASVPCAVMTVHDERRLLENQYAFLDAQGGYSEWPGHKDAPPGEKLLIDVGDLLGRCKKGQAFRRGEVREIATRLHRILWERRAEFWPACPDMGPLEVLDPVTALERLGFQVELAESLGQYSGGSEVFEVAGSIDQTDSTAWVSRRFSPEIRRFTAAHELGHAILHSESGLHRDRALDGTRSDQSRNSTETEADTFAAYFLMPEKQVRLAFRDMFLTDCFELSEDTAFALNAGSLDSLRDRCRTLRDLSRILAGATQYNGVHFNPLARQFGISVEAMAIRLEELDLARI